MLFYVFVFLIPLIIWIILFLVSRRKSKDESAASGVPLEECALCHREFPMEQLIEKEVGGYSRVYCFCGNCIEELYREYREKMRQRESATE
jgi:hypothetical protein